MKYQGIIFDLDGVICHTDQYHYLAWKEIADEIGVYFDEIINNRLRGVSRKKSLEIILERFAGELPKTKEYYLDKKNARYRSLLEKMTPADLSPEVQATLAYIKEKGLKTAIGSSSKNAQLILQRLGLENEFDVVVDGTAITRSKPDPEVFAKAGEQLGLTPEHCLVVEDAKTGVEAARAAHMDCAGIGDAATSTLATYHLKSISDLTTILENTP
jgi:beta-phosphoglucomutase